MKSFTINTKECPVPSDKQSWASKAWKVSIVAASGPRYLATFGVGSSAIPDTDEELVESLLDSFLSDMQDVLNPDDGQPTLRSYVSFLVKELGANVDDAFDIAEEFVSMHTWFSSLNLIEQDEIRQGIDKL